MAGRRLAIGSTSGGECCIDTQTEHQRSGSRGGAAYQPATESCVVDAPPALLDAVNRNPLTIFLLANVQTGAINLSLDTMATSHTAAAAVLTAHMALLCAAAVGLEQWRCGPWQTRARKVR